MRMPRRSNSVRARAQPQPSFLPLLVALLTWQRQHEQAFAISGYHARYAQRLITLTRDWRATGRSSRVGVVGVVVMPSPAVVVEKNDADPVSGPPPPKGGVGASGQPGASGACPSVSRLVPQSLSALALLSAGTRGFRPAEAGSGRSPGLRCCLVVVVIVPTPSARFRGLPSWSSRSGTAACRHP